MYGCSMYVEQLKVHIGSTGFLLVCTVARMCTCMYVLYANAGVYTYKNIFVSTYVNALYTCIYINYVMHAC